MGYVCYGTPLDFAMGVISPLPDESFGIRALWYIFGAVFYSLAVSFFGFGVFEGVKFGTILCALINVFLISRISKLLEKNSNKKTN